MYIFREDIRIAVEQRKMARIIGIAETNLSLILNRKMQCRKVVAYCITKYLDENAEILDYFDFVERKEK